MSTEPPSNAGTPKAVGPAPDEIQLGELFTRVNALPTHLKKDEILKFLINVLSKILATPNQSGGFYITRKDMGLRAQGLNSIKAVIFLNRLKKALGEELGKKLSITALFTYPTAREISEYIAREMFGLQTQTIETAVPNGASAVAKVENESIAIVGMGCHLPGGISDPQMFWDFIKDEKDAITEIPASRWKIDDYFDSDHEVAQKMYIRRGGFVEGVELFDADFFAISPREAMALDPQHRIILECVWNALENAGIPAQSLYNSRGSVFVAISTNEYAELLADAKNRDELAQHIPTGNNLNAAAGRVSYLLGMHGPSMSVDTACSSSLVALNLACQALRAGETDLAIVCGVNLMITPAFTLQLCKTNALSEDGKCKTFDSSANGYVRSEGCGVVILKTASKALADNDSVQALILAAVINQDGSSSSLTAPNEAAQEQLIELALAKAGLKPADVGYVEAHGTGTPLGDPIEMQAIGNVYGRNRPREFPLVIGSVKTNIGHVESASGMAGLIKTTLCLQHRQIPKHLHFKKINPEIDIERIPALIPASLMEWKEIQGRRIAGVSAFGFSGTNGHAILQEYRKVGTIAKGTEIERPLHILCISAKNSAALKDLTVSYLEFFAKNSNLKIEDVCYTASAGRSHYQERIAIVAKDMAELKAKLESAIKSNFEADCFIGKAKKDDKLAVLFSGQGSQYFGMAKQLYESEPGFKASLDRCAAILDKEIPTPLLKVIFEQKGLLDETQYTQPALFALEYSLYELWKSWGVSPDALMGHSLGELVAACVSGVFSLEDGLKLIAKRSGLMQKLGGETAMAAINAPEAEVRKLLDGMDDRVSIAAVNTPTGITISGFKNEVLGLVKKFEAQSVRVKVLAVSHAFHSAQMDPILEEFEKFASGIKLSIPKIPIVSNLNGQIVSQEICVPSYWRKHIRQAVRYADGIASLSAFGVSNFLEIGPGTSGIGMASQCLSENNSINCFYSIKNDLGDWESLLSNVASLYVNGFDIDWNGFVANAPARQKIQLPTYAFQKQKFWVETIKRQNGKFDAFENPILGPQIQIAGNRDIIHQAELGTDTVSFLQDHIVFGTEVIPATGYIDLVLSAVTKANGGGPIIIEGMAIEQPLVLYPGIQKRIQVKLLSGEDSLNWRFQIYSQNVAKAGEPESQWALHSHGKVGKYSGGPVIDSEDSVDDIRARCPATYDVKSFYKILFDGGLEFGAKFHGVTSLNCAMEEAIGKIELASGLESELNSYVFHPSLLDCCQQVLTSVYTMVNVDKNSPRIFLPINYEAIVYHKKPGPTLWSHALFRSGGALKDKSLKCDMRVLDESGDLVIEFQGLTMIEAPREALMKMVQQPGKKIEDWFYQVEWCASDEAKESLESISTQIKANKWLVLSDRGRLSKHIVDKLRAMGSEAIELSSSEMTVYDDVKFREKLILSLNKLSESDKSPKNLKVLFLWGLDRGLELLDLKLENSATVETLEEDQKFVYWAALSLVQTLVGFKKMHEISCSFVTRGAQPAGGIDSELTSISQSTLWGFGKVLALEQPQLSPVMLDLDLKADAIETEGDIVIRESLNSKSEDQIAYRGKIRKVARLKKTSMESGGVKKLSPIIRGDATYLVTGGLGGIGLKIANWLVNSGAKSIVLLGRNAPNKDVSKILDALSAKGVKISFEAVDVASEADMVRVIKIIEKQRPPLKGIIHAAGVVKDAFIIKQSWESYKQVIAPKIKGAWNLYRVTQDQKLDFFCCFSSATSMLGNVGQANYAAANSFLDSFNYYLRARGKVSTSINWGVWAGVGMVEAGSSAQLQLEEMGYELMPVDVGLRALERILETQSSHIGVF